MAMTFTDAKAATMLKQYRRDLHRIPETGWEVYKTYSYIMEILSKLRCEITSVNETGICAFFDMDRETCTAFRCDMDGLAVSEVNECDYASINHGLMHACGHDGHMAMILALASYLNEVTDLSSNVLLIFQPGEETPGGAEIICKTGILEKYCVNRIFGIHLWPFADQGVITCRPGAQMSKSSELDIIIEGKSTHAATPENGIDALEIGCQYLLDIYKMQREEIPSDQRTLLKIGKMGSGTVRNAIAANTLLFGTLRSFDMDIFDYMLKRLKEIAKTYEEKYGCKFRIECNEGYPPLINDTTLYETIKPIFASIPFEELAEPVMISEDFSCFGLHVPSIFFFLGTGTGIPLHSSNFNFDESVLLNGYQLYKKLLSI